jgi:methylglyoxal/glyoxal reductase
MMHATLANGRTMPLLGLGTFNVYGSEAVRAVRHALDIGYRLIDTAAMYGNEAAIGRAVRDSGIDRSDIFIITKVSNVEQGYDSTLRACEQSLHRLQCDYVDMYLIHWPMRGTREDTWKAMETLYRQGKARGIGVSNYVIPVLAELQGYAMEAPLLNQVEFSPYLYLQDLLEYCRRRGIQLQAHSPLTTGRRLDDPKLLALARKYDKTAAQIMLRWILQHGVSAIPKSADPRRLQENLRIFDFALAPEDMARLDQFHENLRIIDDPMDYL